MNDIIIADRQQTTDTARTAEHIMKTAQQFAHCITHQNPEIKYKLGTKTVNYKLAGLPLGPLNPLKSLF